MLIAMIGHDFVFSIPQERINGFDAVIAESNAEAVKHGLDPINHQQNGAPTNGLVHLIVVCADRTKMLTQELLGFIDDAEEGKPFQRTRKSARYW